MNETEQNQPKKETQKVSITFPFTPVYALAGSSMLFAIVAIILSIIAPLRRYDLGGSDGIATAIFILSLLTALISAGSLTSMTLKRHESKLHPPVIIVGCVMAFVAAIMCLLYIDQFAWESLSSVELESVNFNFF